MMVIRKIGDKWISIDKKEMKIDLTKLINIIKKYKIASAKYIGDDLEILVQKVIYKNGKKNVKSKKVLFRDYIKNKEYFDVLNFNDDIEFIINNSNKSINKIDLKKIVIFPTTLVLLMSGISIEHNSAYEESTIDDSNIKEAYVDYINKIDEANNSSDTIDLESNVDSYYSDIVKVEDSDKDIDLIYNMLKEYCDYYSFDEELVSNIYNDNYIDISNSTNKEETIMRLVYEYYTDNLYSDLYVEPNNLTEDEMEKYIVKFANVLGINNEEIIYTMLSVHELETGHGTSNLCLEKNNMGGITFVNPDTGEFGFQHYPNAVAGIIGFVINFDRIYKATIPDEYQDYNFDWNTIGNSIEYYMKPMYCDEPMNAGDPEWDELVCDLKSTLKKNNRLKDLNQMIKDLDNDMYRSK